MGGKVEPTVGSAGSSPRPSHSSRAACILAARSTFWIRCLDRRASRLARRSSLVAVGFTVAAKADLSSGFADDGCGFLVVPHDEAILLDELFAAAFIFNPRIPPNSKLFSCMSRIDLVRSSKLVALTNGSKFESSRSTLRGPPALLHL